ncbi:hydroxyquinol 1,2-dioxygenase [Ramlibacter sp. USB13]|uniref:Hydroxyquinol 1,2-dioxygenase n=1 Tax=Ramlibacter cellulosilyticus TaxID=2764187 RepID=A0A923MU28_9BURK|nr:dioxygenase [Ramlibacter cellulosilyticus]MBC5785258.1 hydroxyquinol 1,2-dioxygenase [Ramlibacter cellulosilyticus]
MAQLEVSDFAQAVIDRMGECKDARFKQVMTSLVKHAHAFMREVDLTPDEWMAGIQFLTETGKKCDEKRQEFILLSDTLGISMLIVALAQARGAKALAEQPGERPTEATVQGPFFWPGAPQKELGDDIGAGLGEPTLYHGRVTDTSGRPIAGCVVDVWSGDEGGLYDMQKGDEMSLRAQFRTDKDGNYRFWSIKPTYYPVPGDGPVGRMLDKMGRHLNRPGHMHMMLDAPGHEKLVTHIFVKDSPYLDSDAVFGVRNSLIVEFPKHAPGKAPDGRSMDKPFYTAKYDFRLVPSMR